MPGLSGECMLNADALGEPVARWSRINFDSDHVEENHKALKRILSVLVGCLTRVPTEPTR